MANVYYNTVVIGAGPAGLLAASEALKVGNCAIFESQERIAKKLLLSGSGQCNITHSGPISSFFDHYGSGSNFLKHSLYSFDNYAIMQFFKNCNLDFVENNEGKIFPKSKKSSDIVNCLVRGLSECKFFNKVKVKSIKKDQIFTIDADSFSVNSKNLIIATGGQSYPGTGSDGSGYLLAESLGHSIISPKPALCPIIVEDSLISDSPGLSFKNITASIWRCNKKIKEIYGDLLFTHKGLSGPIILNNSRYIEKNDIIKVDFSGFGTDFPAKLLSELSSKGKQSIYSILSNVSDLPKSLIRTILSKCNIDQESKGSQISKEERKKIIEFTSECPFKVKDSEGFNRAMVTCGGVSLKEINAKTMESKIVKNLFFAGEILDIDGDTGGYNIQAAFSTGFIAGTSIY